MGHTSSVSERVAGCCIRGWMSRSLIGNNSQHAWLRADCLRVSLSDPRVIRREGWACPRPYQNGSGCWVLECELRRQAGAVHLPAWCCFRSEVCCPSLLSPPFAAQPACGATSLSLGPRALRWACRDVAGLSLGSINFLLVFLQVACAHISEQGRLVRQRFLESSQGLRAETEMFAHLRRSLIDGA